MSWYLAVLTSYAIFEGRARRKEYWLFLLCNVIVEAVLSIVDLATGTFNPRIGTGLLGGVYYLLVLVPSLAVAVRRLHDTNRRGWWLLVSLIPLVGAIILLFFLAQDGDPATNRYGPNPKAEARA